MLVRHGEANDFAEDGQDFLRDLSEKGQQHIETLGTKLPLFLTQEFLMICSPANRTYQTAEIILKNFDPNATPFIVEDLYLAAPDVMLELINDAPDQFESILLVGHNPGISQLIDYLCGTFGTTLKTGTCAIINIDVDSWKMVSNGLGQLQMTIN